MDEKDIVTVLNKLNELQKGANRETFDAIFPAHLSEHMWHKFRANNHQFQLWSMDLETTRMLAFYLSI